MSNNFNLTIKQNKVFKYFKSDVRNVSKGNEYFINYFFPESQLVIDNLPIFFDDCVPLFLINTTKDKGKITLSDMMPNVVVVNVSNKNVIDSKKGFLNILTDALGLKISDTTLKELNTFNETDYWFSVKFWYLMGEIMPFDISSDQSVGSFNLFKSLFVYDYMSLYKLYEESGEPYQKVFATILTMMSKAKNLAVQIGLSPYYFKVLESHSRYLPAYKKAIYNYSQSDITEIDFMNFLYQCSRDYLNK